jgi:hypothetical protein
MDIQVSIDQSRVRVKSGLGLIIFFALVIIPLFFFEISWAVKLTLVVIVFFGLTTALEAWNVRRLKRRVDVSRSE